MCSSLHSSVNYTNWRRQSRSTTSWQGVVPSCLANELCQPADTKARCCLHSALSVVIVTDCPPYTVSNVNRRWPSFSGRRPSCLERSSAARQVSTVTGCLLQSPQKPISSGAAFHDFSSLLSCPRSDMLLRTVDMLIVFVTYARKTPTLLRGMFNTRTMLKGVT